MRKLNVGLMINCTARAMPVWGGVRMMGGSQLGLRVTAVLRVARDVMVVYVYIYTYI